MFETDIGDPGDHTGSFLYLSIPYYWMREMWLAWHATHWQVIEATIESAHRSVGGYKETIRLEIWYSYDFDGQSYSGRVVRDSGFSWRIKAALARYPKGSRVPIKVNSRAHAQSYLPSGLGWVEPFLMAFVSVGGLAILLMIGLGGIISVISRK